MEKEPGSTVIAATINKAGFFKFRATKVGAGYHADPDHPVW